MDSHVAVVKVKDGPPENGMGEEGKGTRWDGTRKGEVLKAGRSRMRWESKRKERDGKKSKDNAR